MSKPTTTSTITLLLLTTSTFLLALIAILLLLVPLQHPLPEILHTHTRSYTQSPSQPQYPFTRTFREHDALEKTSLESPDQLPWESLLLPEHGGGGIFSAEPPDEPPTPNGLPAPVLYGVGMFHQLHCLIALRGIIFPETSQKKENTTAGSFRGKGPEADKVHWAHCFDYLAQTILCGADDTLEPPKTLERDGRTMHYIDGDGGEHRCRDARALFAYAEQSYHEPVDMNDWTEGVGAREFLRAKFEGSPESVPSLYSYGLQRPA